MTELINQDLVKEAAGIRGVSKRKAKRRANEVRRATDPTERCQVRRLIKGATVASD